MNTNNDTKIGPIIGALIIVVLVVIVALYMWGHRLNSTENQTSSIPPVATEQSTTTNTVENVTPEQATSTVNTVQLNNSDDTNSLQQDLDETEKADSETSY